jgi:spore coat protein A, manganese oxidase
VPEEFLERLHVARMEREVVRRERRPKRVDVRLNSRTSGDALDEPPDHAPREALLGTVNEDGSPNSLDWDDPISENPDLDAVEVWEMYNFTQDAHPIHIHEVQFQVVDRQPFEGNARPPEAWETGFKDMVIAYPDEITRVKALFDLPGRYVWHCHIVEHEDNEMMRPYTVG